MAMRLRARCRILKRQRTVPWPDGCRSAERRHFWQLYRQASRASGIDGRATALLPSKNACGRFPFRFRVGTAAKAPSPYAVVERRARGWLRALLARGARRRLRRRTAEQRRSAVRFRRQIELMDRPVAAAAPIGHEVLAAAVGRVADLHRVDGEQAGRFAFVAGLR